MNILGLFYEPVYNFLGGNHIYLGLVNSGLIIGVFWLTSGLFLYSDLTGRPKWMTYYKVQPQQNAPIDKVKLKKALKQVAFNNIFLTLVFAYPMCLGNKAAGIKFEIDELPSLGRFLYEFAMFTIIQEIVFYYFHRMLHHPYFYKWAHKKHHEWTAPVGLIAIYSTPFEYLTGNAMSVFLGPVVMKSHIATIWVWYAIAHIVTIIHHSGYHLPFSPSPQFHDFHHLKFNWNFGTLGILDWLHGTDKEFWKSPEGKRHRALWGFTPVWKHVKTVKGEAKNHVN